MKFISVKVKDQKVANHTFMTWVNGVKVWITALTSLNPTVNEYRVSFEDGPVRYLIIEEFIGTPYEPYIPFIKDLTDKIDEADIRIVNGELFTKS